MLKSKISIFVVGILTGLLIFGGIVYAATLYKATDISYEPTDESWGVNNVSEAMDDLKNQIKELEDKTQSNNWTMIVSYDISLGWNGNTKYGSTKGQLTIKSVDGNINITQTGGAISSPSDKWDGTYYINANTSNFKIESFTLD